MTTDDFLKIIFGVVIIGGALVSRFVKAQRAGQAGTPVAAPPSAAESPAIPPQRVAALLAEMRRRGITPPPALQAFAAANAGTATAPPTYTATPAYAAQPAYAAPPAQPKHRPARAERPPDRSRAQGLETPFSAFPGAFAPAAPRSGSTGGMLARAFGDPGSARNAIILAEVLRPPVALR